MQLSSNISGNDYSSILFIYILWKHNKRLATLEIKVRGEQLQIFPSESFICVIEWMKSADLVHHVWKKTNLI